MALQSEKGILYDLLVSQEWPETIHITKDNNYHSLIKFITKAMKIFNWLTLTMYRNPVTLIGNLSSRRLPVLSDVITSRLPWQLVLSCDGRQLAVLQDDQIEIRSILDEFEQCRAVAKIPKDRQSEWRKLTWCPQGLSLAYANSLGHVTIFDFNGTELYKLPQEDGRPFIMTGAVCGMTFINASGRELFVMVTYGARVTTYNLLKNKRFDMVHSTSLVDYFPAGVGAVQYSNRYNLLLIAGWTDVIEDASPVSCWQLNEEEPYWAPPPGRVNRKFKRQVSIRYKYRKKFNSNWIFTMSLSQDECYLATLSFSGSLSIWNIPSCTLSKTVSHDDLPGSDEHYMSKTSFGFETSLSKKDAVVPIEVAWWSNEAVMLVNSLYKVSIVSLASLSNLLGHSLEPGAAITSAYDGRLLMLESEINVRWTKPRQLIPSLSDEMDEYGGDDSSNEVDTFDETLSWQKKILAIFNHVMYFLTEKEQFRPHKQRIKEQCTQYRLISLKSMTPEECYEKKIINEEYGEALELARQYDLDCDLVYQRQWQLSDPISAAAIQDYLSPVKDRSWILKECLHRVAVDFLTMKELLMYGLYRTSFRELLMIRDVDGDEIDGEVDEADVVSVISKWISLSEDEIFICQCRQSLLEYLDRLNTYEVILGGPAATFELYDPDYFTEFRCKNLIQAAIEYAQDGNTQGVEALFDRHGDIVLPYRLVILCYFPETMSPADYSYLLPSITDDSLDEWELQFVRDEDWVENGLVKKMYSLGKQLTMETVSYDKCLSKYLESPLTGAILTTWYCDRATEIEEYCGLVNHALSLIQYGIDNNVKGLDVIHHHLMTLNSLVYYCQADVRLNLSKLQKFSHMEIFKMIMYDIEDKGFLLRFTNHAMPYMNRLIKLGIATDDRILKEFMMHISKNDLRPCVSLFKVNKNKKLMDSFSTLLPVESKLSLALECIYACERSDQLDEVDSICDHFMAVQISSSDLNQQLTELENYTRAAEILSSYKLPKSIKYIKEIKNNKQEAENLLRRLVRLASRRSPPMSESEWRALQRDMISLTNRVFHSIELHTCIKIYTHSLMCSGSIDNIQLATELLTLDEDANPTNDNLSFDDSLDVIVSTAQEYFNSATGPKDEEIELAKLSLSLVKDFPLPPQVISEKNLVYSLDILAEFNINILPIHVRLCEDKIDLVKQALDSSPAVYKKYDKLFKLSYLLGLSSEPDTSLHSMSSWTSLSTGRGHTIIYIALAALQNGDHKTAHRLCSVLVNCKFPDAWEVCKNLATSSAFKDLEAKMSLVNFAVCYCPLEELEIVLKQRNYLEIEMMHKKFRRKQLMEKGTVQHIVSKSVQRFVNLAAQKKDDDGEELSDETMSKFVTDLQQIFESNDITSTDISLSYHPFYDQLNSHRLTYSGWQEANDKMECFVPQFLLYIYINMPSLNDDDETSYNNLCLSLATSHVSCDLHMVLGYLLQITNSFTHVNSFLSRVSPSALLYHMVIYYCSLVLYAETTQLNNSSLLAHHPPLDMINHVKKFISNSNTSDWPEQCRSLVGYHKDIIGTLYDYIQTIKLKSCGIGVDIVRFLQDESYMKQFIMSLARQGNEAVYDISVSLCYRHSLDVWDLYMSHLDWLLTESEYLADEIMRRVNKHRILNLLLHSPQKVADHLHSSTYYNIPSTRYSIFHIYFTFLQQCINSGASIKDSAVSIDVHLKLLQKFKTMFRKIDYRDLMSSSDPLSVLTPSLAEHNIHEVAKLAINIPLKDKGVMSSAMIYRAFFCKVFWEIDDSVPDPYSQSAWMDRLNLCHGYLQKLDDAEQFKIAVDDVIFSQNSLNLMTVETRLGLLKFIEICTEMNLSSQGFPLDDLHIYQKHLKTVKSLNAFPEVEKTTWKIIVKKYDMTISLPAEIYQLAKYMCMMGMSMESIELVLLQSHSVRAHTIAVNDVVIECINDILESGGNDINKLDIIVMAVSNHEQEESGRLLKMSDVQAVMEPYYTLESNNSLAFKCGLLKCIFKYITLSSETERLLVFYQAKLLLEECFDNQAITINNFTDTQTQKDFFFSLLEQSLSLKQLKKLAELLEEWPKQSVTLHDCWLKVLLAIASYPDDDSLNIMLLIRGGILDMDIKVDMELIQALWDRNKLICVHLSLLTTSNKALNTILEHKITTEDWDQMLNNTMLELILYNGHIPSIVNTSIYPGLSSYLINPPSFDTSDINRELFARMLRCDEGDLCKMLGYDSPVGRVDKAVHQLRHAGLVEEAEMLLNAQTASRTSLMGVTSAFRSLKGFFSS